MRYSIPKSSLDTMKVQLLTSLLLSAIGIIYLSIILPIMFKFGAEKGRILMMLVLFVPVGILMLFQKFGLKLPGKEALNALALAAPLIIIAILALSIAISLKVYNRKEL